MYRWTRGSSGKLMLLLGVSAGRVGGIHTVGRCYSTKGIELAQSNHKLGCLHLERWGGAIYPKLSNS